MTGSYVKIVGILQMYSYFTSLLYPSLLKIAQLPHHHVYGKYSNKIYIESEYTIHTPVLFYDMVKCYNA